MKFALIGPTHPFRGGIAHYTTSLQKALSEDHEVLLVSFSRLYPGFLFPGKTQHDESGGRFAAPGEALLDSMNPLTWRAAARRINEFRPDAVVFQWWQVFFAPAFAALVRFLKKDADVPVFYLCHNVYPHERLTFPLGSYFERRMIQLAFGRVDGFLVHSEKLIMEVERFKPGAQIERIYHPLYDFYSQWDVDVEVPDDSQERNLLFFGKIREYKGLEIFLKALPLVNEGIDFKAVVAGEFYVDAQPFKQLVEDLGLSDRVVWMDRYIENEGVPELFRKADLVVLPYLSATQSGVVPLAYQFDVPVIASDVGGLSEVVLDGKTGYLTPVGDFRYLAGRIDEYFLGEKGEEFRENIRQFKQRLSWPQVIDSILSLLNNETCRRNERPRDERMD